MELVCGALDLLLCLLLPELQCLWPGSESLESDLLESMTLATLCLSSPCLSSSLIWDNLVEEDTPGGLEITVAEVCGTDFRAVVLAGAS